MYRHRVLLICPAALRDKSGRILFRGRAADVSPCGIRVIGKGGAPLHEGLPVWVELSLPRIRSTGPRLRIVKLSGEVRRININIAALPVDAYRQLKEARVGTYQLFQETYHYDTFHKMHPEGPKADYLYHLTAMDRAMQGGIEDVGLGVLYGLYDWKYDTVGMLMHAEHLEAARRFVLRSL